MVSITLHGDAVHGVFLHTSSAGWVGVMRQRMSACLHCIGHSDLKPVPYHHRVILTDKIVENFFPGHNFSSPHGSGLNEKLHCKNACESD